jgi:hypothetical protein
VRGLLGGQYTADRESGKGKHLTEMEVDCRDSVEVEGRGWWEIR